MGPATNVDFEAGLNFCSARSLCREIRRVTFLWKPSEAGYSFIAPIQLQRRVDR